MTGGLELLSKRLALLGLTFYYKVIITINYQLSISTLTMVQKIQHIIMAFIKQDTDTNKPIGASIDADSKRLLIKYKNLFSDQF